MAKPKKEASKKKKKTGKLEHKGTVTKKDLAEALQAKYGSSLADNERWVNGFFEIFKEQLAEKGRAEIRDFGVFKVNRVKAHTTVNLKSKKSKKTNQYKKLRVPETFTVDFRTSKSYKDALKETWADSKPKKSKRKKSKKSESKEK